MGGVEATSSALLCCLLAADDVEKEAEKSILESD